MEGELETLIAKYKLTNQQHEDAMPLYKYFAKMIQKDMQINTTKYIRDNMFLLSKIDDGLLWHEVKKVIADYTPEMLVPKIHLPQNSRNFRPRRIAKISPASDDLPKTLYTNIPYTQRKTIKVPMITTRSVIPTLATMKPGNFFFCSKKKEKYSKMSYKIHHKSQPPYPLSHDYSILSQSGLFKINGTRGEFTSIDDYLYDKECLYMSSLLPVFQNWIVNKSFIKWNYKLRMKRHRRIQNQVLNSCPCGHTEFFDLMGQIRSLVFSVFHECSPISKEMPIDTFENLSKNTAYSLAEMNRKVAELNDMITEKLSHFIQQIQKIELLLRSDLQILKTIGALPKSIIPYSVEHQVNAPSLVTSQTMNHLLYEERKKAHDRLVYLPKFFIMVKLFMRDFFFDQLNETLNEFYSRFIDNGSSDLPEHQILVVADPGEGLALQPSLSEFLDWFNSVEFQIKCAYSKNTINLPYDAVKTIGETPAVEEMIDLDPEVQEKRKIALEQIQQSYTVFAEAITSEKSVMKDMFEKAQGMEMRPADSAEFFCNQIECLVSMTKYIDERTRIIRKGTLFSDMKPAKTAAYECFTNKLEIAKSAGIEFLRNDHESLSRGRSEYMARVADRERNGTKKIKSEEKQRKELLAQCEYFVLIAGKIEEHWNDVPMDVVEKAEATKELMQMLGKKKKKVIKKIIRNTE